VPCRTTTTDNSSASDVSSLDTQSQIDKENRRRHDFQQRTLRHVSDKAIYKLPNSKDNFLQWEQLTEVELLQDTWCVGGLTIMRHLHTTTTNRQVSANFCNYLQRCALQGGESVNSEVLSGNAKALIVQGHGCELHRHLLNMYKPVRPRSLWEYNDQWSLVKQRKSETIQGFAGRIQSLQEKFKECGLILPSLAIKLKIVSGVCGGPYHDVFTKVYHRMCVLNDSLWQLDQVPEASLVNRLTGILHASHHWGQGKFQPGAYPKVNPLDRSAQMDEATNNSPCTDGWEGTSELSWSQAFSILKTYKCPICRPARHSIMDCAVAQKRGPHHHLQRRR
jgi:hypothetical protein